jgi:hypothetical protein
LGFGADVLARGPANATELCAASFEIADLVLDAVVREPSKSSAGAP